MADVIHVENGYSPWQPSGDAELSKQYQYYEIPLRGVIVQHDVRYYFGCVGGAGEPVNFWLYAMITPEEEAVLDSTPREEFQTAIPFDSPAVLALAIDGTGIIASVVTDDLSEKSVHRAFDYLQAEVRSWASSAQEVELAYAT